MTHRNYNIPELRRLDVAHHLPAQQNHRMMQEIGGSRIITRAEGCTIYDADGTPILDGMAGLWCVQVGYGREELARAAYDQMLELPYYNTFFKTASPPTVMLAAKLSELLGGNLSHIFFNNSGSEAIDTIIRLARYYWQIKGQPDRNIIIARENGYHGSTIGGVSLGGMKSMRAQGGPLVPGFEHVMQPYPFGEGFGEDPEAFAKRAADAIEEKILAVGPERVAAVVGEPVQGAGGVIIPPPSYWPRVEAICRKYGVLLVFDEVICGFGRLGKWFGFQHFGVKPDLVSMAKGLSSGYIPISAVGVSRPYRRCAAQRRQGFRAWLHLFGASDSGRRRAQESGNHGARRPRAAHGRRDRTASGARYGGTGQASDGGRGAFAGPDRRGGNRLAQGHK